MSGDYSYEEEAIHRWECEVAFDSLKDIAETVSLRDREIEKLKCLVESLEKKRKPMSAIQRDALLLENDSLKQELSSRDDTIESLAKMVADERELRLAAKQEAQTLRSALQHTQSTLSLYIKEYGDFDDS